MKAKVMTLLVIVCVAGTGFTQSQSPDPVAAYEQFPKALGFAYGPIAGTGLHYHVWGDSLGYQVTAGVLYYPPGDDDSIFYFSNSLDYVVGGELQWRVFGEAFAEWFTGALYLFAGASHRGYVPVVLVAGGYVDDNDTPDDFEDDVWVPEEYANGPFEAQLTAGGGIGIEVVLFRHFSFPFEFGYGATWTATEPVLADALRVNLSLQTAVRYRY